MSITVTLAGLPAEFKADDKYGLHLRGWNPQTSKVEDEPKDGLEDALSLRVIIDGALEARWSIFNDRIPKDEPDPPALRYKHARQLSTTRLGPYAERHLGWSRQSVLTRLAIRAGARSSARRGKPGRTRSISRRQSGCVQGNGGAGGTLGKLFSVPVREKYAAELDVQGVSITAGGISLHDGKLPLRRLGTGSSRLIVSALQHDAGGAHIALIDEVEHGLEPHRIARLLKYLSTPSVDGSKAAPSQIFMTTHSPVVIRELTAADIFAVRCNAGLTDVRSVAAAAKGPHTAQAHLRRTPDAFLARKVIVGEGRTEQGLLRGLDAFWSIKGTSDSFALCGANAIDGGGNGSAPVIAEHLLDLGYGVFLLLDSDEHADAALVEKIKKKGGIVHEWAGNCSTEERIFLDVPWATVVALIRLAVEYVTTDSVKYNINKICKEQGLVEVVDLSLPAALDTPAFRGAIGKAAKNESNPWFKDIARGERVGDIVGECLEKIPSMPLAQGLTSLRQWVDG